MYHSFLLYIVLKAHICTIIISNIMAKLSNPIKIELRWIICMSKFSNTIHKPAKEVAYILELKERGKS